MRRGDHESPLRRAAVVQGDGMAVGHLLQLFGRDLHDAGVVLAGFLEEPPLEPGCGPTAPRRLQDLGRGEQVTLCRALPNQAGCAPDVDATARICRTFELLADVPPDIVLASGWERDQRGLWWERLDVLAAQGIPVLLVLRRHEVEAWLAGAGGVGTLLDAKLSALHDWWRSVAPRWPRSRAVAGMRVP